MELTVADVDLDDEAIHEQVVAQLMNFGCIVGAKIESNRSEDHFTDDGLQSSVGVIAGLVDAGVDQGGQFLVDGGGYVLVTKLSGGIDEDGGHFGPRALCGAGEGRR